MSTTTGTKGEEPAKARHIGDWEHHAVVARSYFKHKSLCCWSVNVAMGCLHGCTFCYVPSTSANKQEKGLGKKGVKNPGGEWGQYGFLRNWDEKKFLASLRKAENTPRDDLNPDGNRAVIYSSTTDPYQAWPTPELRERSREIMRRSLELIRDRSSLNVRILTRSPLAKKDFDLYLSFGHRLVFCMSIATLNNRLARMYEPNAPAPTQRLKTLQEAKKAGLHVGVAIAPTYPECDEADLRATLEVAKALDPVTIYHEPINTRADNVRRMEARARELGVALNTGVYETTEAWVAYQLQALRTVEKLAGEMGLEAKLKLWIDKRLASEGVIKAEPVPKAYRAWVKKWKGRIADWPKEAAPQRPARAEAKVEGKARPLPVARKNPAGTRLYYRPDIYKPQPEIRGASKFIYYEFTDDLRDLANGYLNAIEWLKDEVESLGIGSPGGIPRCDLTLSFQRLAQARAVRGELLNLECEKHHSERPSAERVANENRGNTDRTVSMDAKVFLACEYDFSRAAKNIVERNANYQAPRGANHTRCPWRMLQLVRQYRRVLHGNRPVSVTLEGDDDDEGHSFCQELSTRQQAVLKFLEALDDRHRTDVPRLSGPQPVQYVIHFDREGNPTIKGQLIRLNVARQAALCALGLLGTKGVSIRGFTLLYRHAGSARQDNERHYSKTFLNAMKGLGGRLHLLRYEPSGRRFHYNVFGLEFKSVKKDRLRGWLFRNNRGPRGGEENPGNNPV